MMLGALQNTWSILGKLPLMDAEQFVGSAN